MNLAVLFTDALLETGVGPTQAHLDDIMAIILKTVDEIASGNPERDIPRFETLANQRLADANYPIEFSSDNPRLYTAPAAVDLDGMIIRTPQHIRRHSFERLRNLISHEGVHVYQVAAATERGDPEAMFNSAHKRMMPGGQLDPAKYHTDKHEVMAYARSLIDQYRQQRISRSQALQMLRTDPGAGLLQGKQQNRFRKLAYQYAQNLPESVETEDPDVYARRKGYSFFFDSDNGSLSLEHGFFTLEDGVPKRGTSEHAGSLWWRLASKYTIELEHQEVDEPHRGKGLGKAMLRKFLKHQPQLFPEARYVTANATSLGVIKLLRKVFGPEVQKVDTSTLTRRAPKDWTSTRNRVKIKFQIPNQITNEALNSSNPNYDWSENDYWIINYASRQNQTILAVIHSETYQNFLPWTLGNTSILDGKVPPSALRPKNWFNRSRRDEKGIFIGPARLVKDILPARPWPGTQTPEIYLKDAEVASAYYQSQIEFYKKTLGVSSEVNQRLIQHNLEIYKRELAKAQAALANPTISQLPESIEQDVAQAAKDTERQPTDAQKEAGNYAKGTVWIQGLKIKIENPKGSIRTGMDKNGKAWSATLPAHYGYIAEIS